jgi:hypothetical protein
MIKRNFFDKKTKLIEKVRRLAENSLNCMWGFLLRTAASVLGGWVASDIYNEYQTTKQVSANTITSSLDATTSAAKNNWVKWTVIAVVGSIVTWILLQAIKIFKAD